MAPASPEAPLSHSHHYFSFGSHGVVHQRGNLTLVLGGGVGGRDAGGQDSDCF